MKTNNQHKSRTSLLDAHLCYLAAEYFSSKDEDLHGSYMEESKKIFRSVISQQEAAS